MPMDESHQTTRVHELLKNNSCLHRVPHKIRQEEAAPKEDKKVMQMLELQKNVTSKVGDR